MKSGIFANKQVLTHSKLSKLASLSVQICHDFDSTSPEFLTSASGYFIKRVTHIIFLNNKDLHKYKKNNIKIKPIEQYSKSNGINSVAIAY